MRTTPHALKSVQIVRPRRVSESVQLDKRNWPTTIGSVIKVKIDSLSQLSHYGLMLRNQDDENGRKYDVETDRDGRRWS